MPSQPLDGLPDRLGSLVRPPLVFPFLVMPGRSSQNSEGVNKISVDAEIIAYGVLDV